MATKEQIIALINAKIAGQGSAVDVGGALPAILKGIAEMGISSDMDESEQMQARKDLGLYYEQSNIEEKTASYTDESESVNLPGFYLISDDTPEKTDIVSMIVGEDEFTDLILEDRGDDDGYTITSKTNVFGFVVILSEAAGNTPGIYVKASVKDTAELKYNATVITISKVPAKYLPVAWNQVVTEGTKIAEVTIGEETTEVFAPEGGGGGLEQITLLQKPEYSSSGITLTDYISNVDLAKLLDGSTVVAKYEDAYYGTRYYLVTTRNQPQGTYVNQEFLFYGTDGAEFKFTRTGAAANPTESVVLMATRGVAEIYDLPTSSITTQAGLDAIGLTYTVIIGILSGEITRLFHTIHSVENDGSEILPIRSASDVPPEVGFNSTITIVFESTSNHYKIVKVGTSITVTVTAIS